MKLESLRKIALALPGVTEDIKWDNHLCFNIGGKMFLVTNPDQVPVSASFKTADDDFETLSSRQGIILAPYMARNKWVLVEDITTPTDAEWNQWVTASYQLIFAKLTKKAQREILSS
ncbi:MmcQ/YjbR family DNA-binding protein [Flavobacterium caeni]|uniref:MmcQ/YjbR family DNA-binding protein n=1 Tax=Flavobacterium caeni TaxID=490189 RepID=UPI000B82C572|nr:MmcQ/YjbR family DNA-binding protein [Flavobacterium caeni]